MIKIKIGVRYKCKKCGKFLFEKDSAGYLISNPKANKVSNNGGIYKIICSCTKESAYEV
ncbi:MAG: hypothetical protein ACRDDH_03100 [Cetobacterium sp.]|uniref:hypothetical protein n=1 Tax=Cetobacterium sp. TaxID=2071632 RepID=UPI003EE5A0A3